MVWGGRNPDRGTTKTFENLASLIEWQVKRLLGFNEPDKAVEHEHY
jgi:hypothetical protein